MAAVGIVRVWRRTERMNEVECHNWFWGLWMSPVLDLYLLPPFPCAYSQLNVIVSQKLR